MPISRRPTSKPASSGAADPADLVDRVRGGDVDALGTLYERYGNAVFGAAFRCLASHEEAEDVLQDVFLGLPDALKSYEERGKFEAWIRRVTVRAALMRMRQHQRLREDPLDAAAETSAMQLQLQPRLVDRLAARQAIERLPDTLRVVFMLTEVEGYSHAETAEMLGITPGASAARLFRAWRMLLTHTEERQ